MSKIINPGLKSQCEKMNAFFYLNVLPLSWAERSSSES